MKKTTVPYMDENTCTEKYEDWPLCKKLTFPNELSWCPRVTDICSGGNEVNKEDCASDTGGPVIDINKQVCFNTLSINCKQGLLYRQISI